MEFKNEINGIQRIIFIIVNPMGSHFVVEFISLSDIK